METMRDIIVQELNEGRYNRKHIDVKIRKAIEANSQMQGKVTQGVGLVTAYMNGAYYSSKMQRLEQLQNMDIPALVMDIVVGVAYVQNSGLFPSVSGPNG